jgi:hypothetical protein
MADFLAVPRRTLAMFSMFSGYITFDSQLLSTHAYSFLPKARLIDMRGWMMIDKGSSTLLASQ